MLLDRKNISRRIRAFSGWTVLFAMVWVVHIWAYFYQRCADYRFPCIQKSRLSRGYTRENLPLQLDIHDRGYTPRIWLYIFCGLLDAIWQITAYWLMGAMSNDPVKLAHFSGLCPYKCPFPISTELITDDVQSHRQVNPVCRCCWSLES